MKKAKMAVAALAAAVLCTSALGLAACGDGTLPETPPTDGDQNTTQTTTVHTVTFNANGGKFQGDKDTVEVKTKTDGTVEFPLAPVRENYEFLGYTVNDDGTGKAIVSTTVFDKDTTVFAKWEVSQTGGGSGNQGGGDQTGGGDDQTGGGDQGGGDQGVGDQGGGDQGGGDQGGGDQGGGDQGGGDQGGGETTTKGNGLYAGNVQKGEFTDDNTTKKEIWAYDVDFSGGALELYYNNDKVTGATYSEYSTEELVWTDDTLKLDNGISTTGKSYKVLYKYEANEIYAEVFTRATIGANDGVKVVGGNVIKTISQNVAKAEVMAESITVTEQTDVQIILGGDAVAIETFEKATTVKAKLGADKKTVTLAAGTYAFYYEYGATQKLYIGGTSTGELTGGDETPASNYKLVGTIGGVNKWGSNDYVFTPLSTPSPGAWKSYSLTIDLKAKDAVKTLMFDTTLPELQGSYVQGDNAEWRFNAFDSEKTKDFAKIDGEGNFVILDGCDGSYTFTLNLYDNVGTPDNMVDGNFITVKKNGTQGGGTGTGGGDEEQDKSSYFMVGSTKTVFEVGNEDGTLHDLFKNGVSLNKDSTIEFYFNGQKLNVWINADCVGVKSKNTNAETVTVNFTDTYNINLKQWEDTGNWTVSVKAQNNVDEITPTGKTAVTVQESTEDNPKCYLVGTVQADSELGWNGKGYEMTWNSTTSEWELKGVYLHANDTVKMRQGSNDSNGNNTIKNLLESGSTCEYAAYSGGDIKLTKDGYYDFYFAPSGNNGYGCTWIAYTAG